jgi:hypothetical protein
MNAPVPPKGIRDTWRSFHRWVKPRFAALVVLALGVVVLYVLMSRASMLSSWPLVAFVTAAVFQFVALLTVLRLNDLLTPEQDRPTRSQFFRAARTGVLATLGLATAITVTLGIILLVMD